MGPLNAAQALSRVSVRKCACGVKWIAKVGERRKKHAAEAR